MQPGIRSAATASRRAALYEFVRRSGGLVDQAVGLQTQGARHRLGLSFGFFLIGNEEYRRRLGWFSVVAALRNRRRQPVSGLL